MKWDVFSRIMSFKNRFIIIDTQYENGKSILDGKFFVFATNQIKMLRKLLTKHKMRDWTHWLNRIHKSKSFLQITFEEMQWQEAHAFIERCMAFLSLSKEVKRLQIVGGVCVFVPIQWWDLYAYQGNLTNSKCLGFVGEYSVIKYAYRVVVVFLCMLFLIFREQ